MSCLTSTHRSHRHRFRNHAGFTLVELLVVIAIIGILIGMLLPAVQQVREAARRSTCANQLKQLSLAMLNYESSHRSLPPGLENSRQTVPNGYKLGVFSWGTFILPHMEQNSLYDILSPNQNTLADRLSGPDGDAVEQACKTPLANFRCPADDAPEIGERTMPNVQGGLGLSNYVANNGSGRILWKTIDDSIDSWRVDGPFDGVNETNLADIFDGTSNTILLGERVFENGPMAASIPDDVRQALPLAASIYGAKGYGHDEGASDENKNHGIVDVAFCGTGYINDFNSFAKRKAASSRHPGGVQFSFADGSVHFASETMDQGNMYGPVQQSLYKQLLAIDDGLVVTNDF